MVFIFDFCDQNYYPWTALFSKCHKFSTVLFHPRKEKDWYVANRETWSYINSCVLQGHEPQLRVIPQPHWLMQRNNAYIWCNMMCTCRSMPMLPRNSVLLRETVEYKIHAMINRKRAIYWLNMFGRFNAQQMKLNKNYACISAPFLGIQGPRLQWHSSFVVTVTLFRAPIGALYNNVEGKCPKRPVAPCSMWHFLGMTNNIIVTTYVSEILSRFINMKKNQI